MAIKHRISAGALLEDDGRVLLVRNHKPGVYDFWVAPGGGAEGIEDLRTTVAREAREECGLEIEPLRIAYIEELWTAEMRVCKLWFTGRIVGGSLTTKAPEAKAEHIVAAEFLSRSDLEGKTVFPRVLLREYWEDRVTGFLSPRYLGMREMRF